MRYIVMTAVLLALSGNAFSHGAAPAPQHGGIVSEASDEHWVELVLRGSQIVVFVNDQGNKPVPSVQIGAKATVLVGGKSQQVVLTAAEANSLVGKLDVVATGKVTSVVTLTIDGKTATVRFVTAQ